MFFDKAAILGVGLIGASIALAIREKGLCNTIHGYGRNEANLIRARRLGIIDDYSMDPAVSSKGADLIVLAAPVGVLKKIAGDIGNSIKQGTLVTDAGSVKGRLVYDIEACIPAGSYYIGSHPIAGSEKSGIDDAKAGLFNKALCIITPTENSDMDALQKVAAIWSTLGGKVEFIDPFEHDRIYAAVSHLPHVIAYALVNALNSFNADYIKYAGQGFKDTTRIAMSSPELWRDIAIYNKDNLVNLMGILRENISNMEKLLAAGDTAGIEREFSKAQRVRKKLQ